MNGVGIPHRADCGISLSEELWRRIGDRICKRHRLNYSRLESSPTSENYVLFVDQAFVIKIFLPQRNMFSRELLALGLGKGMDLRIPRMLHFGEMEGWSYLVMKKMRGQPLPQPWATLVRKDQIEIISELGAAMRRLHSQKIASAVFRKCRRPWLAFLNQQVRVSAERQRAKGASEQWLNRLAQYLNDSLHLLPTDSCDVLLHGDLHPANLLVYRRKDRWIIRALVDFADSLIGFCEYDFVKPMLHMAFADPLLQQTLLLSYGYKEREFDVRLRRRLMLLTILHEGSNLKKACVRLGPGADSLTFQQLEERIWPFL
ncbi:MAG TPA: aminoglycoside phosphotransferase family protein [Pyrinomonadaceae bacterium]|nr:aminoglycoside phosphotransferase family protein [Pyrinomonadaceae bacterium]